MKYRKKPVVIEAIQYTGDNALDILRFMFPDIEPDAEATLGTIKTLEGDMQVSKEDFIIRGVKGEFYPCKPDIFEQTYEPVKEVSNE